MSMRRRLASSTPVAVTVSTWRQKFGQKSYPYLFIAPFFILFAIFGLFPYLYAFLLSFMHWDGIGPQTWIGLDNYRALLTDSLWWQSLYNTFWLLVVTAVNLPLALGLAFMVNSKFVRFRHFFRSAYFMPMVAAPVAVATIFLGLFGDKYGVLNYLLAPFGVPTIDWMNDSFWVKPAIAIVVIWSLFGWNVIIYLAGLQAIPPELYEAAACDGATTRQIFFGITVPLMWPVINFTLILSIIGGLQLFDIPMILMSNGGSMGSGGPGNSGLTTMMYLYNTGFRYLDFGYSSAISIGLFIIILVFSFVYYKAISRKR